ncbi:hypothetical protein GCM10028808_17200 [Spirosoma migulaei]
MSLLKIDAKEKAFIRAAVLRKYHEFQQDMPLTYNEINGSTFKPAYTGLVISFDIELSIYLKDNKIPKSILGSPKESFFVKLFDKNDYMNCRISNLNACYLYAFRKTREAYINNRDTNKESVFQDIYDIRLAQYDDIRKIYNIACTIYGGLDVMPYKTLISWYEKNPCSFYVIIDEDNEVVGNINILPLKEETLKSFLEGRLLERDITEEGIWGTAEKEYINYLYIESVVNLGGKEATKELLKKIPTIITNFGCSHDSIKKLYCMSVSRQGQRLIKRLGFKEIVSVKLRRDGHTIFEAELMDVLHNVYKIYLLL